MTGGTSRFRPKMRARMRLDFGGSMSGAAGDGAGVELALKLSNASRAEGSEKARFCPQSVGLGTSPYRS